MDLLCLPFKVLRKLQKHLFIEHVDILFKK